MFISDLFLKIIVIVDTYIVNTHIFLKKNWDLEILIFRWGSMVSCELWYHVIFSPIVCFILSKIAL
jgi:hypothetical protein